jgi:hypothetical protein
MSDATGEQETSDDAQRSAASRASMKLAAVMTALTLGPVAALTGLAIWEMHSDMPFLFGWIFLFGWTFALVNLASARCQNVVARWLLLGPGDFKTRATFGAVILAGDWLMTALLIRALAPDGPMRLYVTVAWMTGMSSTLPFLWWLIVRGRGGRDVVPGVRFFARTFGTRDLMLGLFLAGLALAGARVAFAFVGQEGGSFSLSTDTGPEFLQLLLASLGCWTIDAGLRMFILGKNASARGFAILAGFVLILGAIAAALAAESALHTQAFVLPFMIFVYAVMGTAHEATLRFFGVRAINLRSATN